MQATATVPMPIPACAPGLNAFESAGALLLGGRGAVPLEGVELGVTEMEGLLEAVGPGETWGSREAVAVGEELGEAVADEEELGVEEA